MSKSFINTIYQEGGELSKLEKVKVLNEISKAINKKMKIIEFDYGIKLKFNKLPENNEDCIPKKIGIQSYAQINGPIKGHIPFYTEISAPIMPTITTVTSSVPLTPFGPFVGIQSLAINPFGTTADRLDERLKKAKETLEKIIEIRTSFKTLKKEGKTCTDHKESLKKYFDCIDLKDEPDDNIMSVIDEILKTDE